MNASVLRAALAASLLAACSSSSPHVYVAGHEERTTAWVAMLWANGQPLPLDEEHSSTATGVAVAGGDVYVSGSVRFGPTSEAVYWKNGQVVRLTDGTREAWATDIAVAEGSVYVVGVEGARAMVWKDGVPTPLTSGARQAVPEAIAVADAHVYVAGSEVEPVEVLPGTYEPAWVAKLWVDGVARPLTEARTTRWAHATGVAVSGDDVHVSGLTTSSLHPDAHALAAVWNGGTLQALTDGTQPASAEAVALAGSDVLVGGSVFDGTNDTPVIWKNGVALEVAHRFSTARVVALATSGADVYAAGNDGGSAVLWVNGEPRPLSDGAVPAIGAAIAVVDR